MLYKLDGTDLKMVFPSYSTSEKSVRSSRSYRTESDWDDRAFEELPHTDSRQLLRSVAALLL
jgi:hypothetical protein